MQIFRTQPYKIYSRIVSLYLAKKNNKVKKECQRLKSCAEDFQKELEKVQNEKEKKAAEVKSTTKDVSVKSDTKENITKSPKEDFGQDELKSKFQKIASNLKVTSTIEIDHFLVTYIITVNIVVVKK